MPPTRPLPKKRNPLLAFDRTPELSELAAKRRLGSTKLEVKPGQVGTSNATKPENLGKFEYAHLRAPLPENLKSSEIFAPQPKMPHPEAYFLMRRSSDGHVSATGMFKASFPWAKISEEIAERDYVKSLPKTGQDEVAGNVWVPEDVALELGEDYGITPWIVALLDPSEVSTIGIDADAISSPPKFDFKFKAGDKLKLSPPASTPARGRGRPRASSPAKATPGNKLTSPKKRTSKKIQEASAAAARQASDSLQAALDSAASVAENMVDKVEHTVDKVVESVTDSEQIGEEATPATEVDNVNGADETDADADEASDAVEEEEASEEVNEAETSEEINEDEDKVVVNVHTDVEVNGDVETTHTSVQVKMPADHAELPLPEDTAAMIAKAKEMVEEAVKLEGGSSNKAGKRKAEILDADDDEAADNGRITQPSKRPKVLEQEVKRQKVRNRALVGVVASLAIGAIVPYVLGA